MLLFLFIPFIMYGQGSTTSSLSGKVLDSKGTPLPGANILAVHVPSGTQYATMADKAGNYSIQNMRVGGPYSVKVSFIGYTSSNYTDIMLKLGETYVQDAQLGEATATLQEVVVTAVTRNSILSSERSGPQTNVATVSLTVSRQSPGALLISRNYHLRHRATPSAAATAGSIPLPLTELLSTTTLVLAPIPCRVARHSLSHSTQSKRFRLMWHLTTSACHSSQVQVSMQ